MTTPLERFLAAVEKLPPTTALTFRGLPLGALVPADLVVTQGVMATSRDPLVASEGRTHQRLLAIAGRSGRDLSPLSSTPAEREVVLLPGTALRPVARLTVEEAGVVVVVLEDVTPDIPQSSGLPATLPDLVGWIQAAVSSAWASAAGAPTAPAGKFAGPIL